MILTRWRTVHGCIEWLRLRVPRYVGPEVHGLPSLGPCTRAAFAGAPALFVPGAAPLPAYAAPPLEVAPYAGAWIGGPGFFLPGEYPPPGDVVAIPPSFPPAPFELPPGALAVLPPGSPPPALEATPSPTPGTGPLPRLSEAPPGAPPTIQAGGPPAPPENVPEPGMFAIVAAGVAAAVLMRRRLSP